MRSLYIPLCFVYSITQAQSQLFDVNSNNATIRYNNPLEIGKKNGSMLDYSEVRGSSFWDDQWHPALLVLRSGSAVKMQKVKLNLYSNDVYYVDPKGVELVAQEGMVKKVTMYDRKDTTKIASVFHFFSFYTDESVESFLQVLNQGRICLLKRTKVKLVKGNYDPLLGKNEFSFVNTTSYFIYDKGTISQLKGFSKNAVMSVVSITPEYETWLNNNKNRLRNEGEVMAFLSFCSSKLN